MEIYKLKKIAVLIPSYKPENYFEKCLLSIQKQTLSKDKFCVYIALNGPRFPYEEYILEVLFDSNFEYRYIYIEKAGVSNARNKLIDISEEEYIVFIDDDDLISENYLENLLKVSSNKIMGISNIYTFENDLKEMKENYISKSFTSLNDRESSKYKIRKYFSSPVAKMIHRKMIEDIKFDERLSKGEDSLFMAMISKNIDSIQKASIDTYYHVYERVGSATRQKVNVKKEVKTIFYLTFQYIKLFFKRDYQKVFILTRIAATLLKLIKIIGNKKWMNLFQ